MDSVQHQLERLLCDRRSPEARALYLTLLQYVERRVQAACRARYRDLLAPPDAEEVVADVGMRLMTGALARFRGTTLAELYAYVRTITDRSLGRLVRRRLREREAVAEIQSAAQALDAASPEGSAEVEAACPLEGRDRTYLLALLQAGSKAEYARQHDQSRAAVTRMVQRIRSRIEALDPDQRTRAEVWMWQQARDAIEAQAAAAH